MNLVADECVPRPVVDQLRADGHTVTWIGESQPGIGDAYVLAFALQAGAPLLTIDTDFGELVFRENRPSGGVVLLRLEGLLMTKPNRLRARSTSAYRTEGNRLKPLFQPAAAR